MSVAFALPTRHEPPVPTPDLLSRVASKWFGPPDPTITDPALWARKRLDASLWSKQVELMHSVRDNRRTAVKSGHGIGKSYSAGVLACWWIDIHPPGTAMVVSTAPSYKQVHAVLWEEIRKHNRRKVNGQKVLPGKVNLSDEWTIDDVLVAMGRKPADHDDHAFQGIHRRYVLVLLDEACGIPQSLWTAAEAITTNEDCRILAIGNPDDPNTEFGKVCKPGSGWNVMRIAVQDSPNFTGEQVPPDLRYLLPSPQWVEDAGRRWGVSSPMYTSKVLGEFPELGDDTLIPARWIERAQASQPPSTLQGPHTLGVDIARFGSDYSVAYERTGPVVRQLRKWSGAPTTESAGIIISLLRETGAPVPHVDGAGIGGGVVDILVEQQVPCADMQLGGAAIESDRFVNARAEWFWNLRVLFEQGEIFLDPADDILAAQLGSIKYTYDSRGRVKIESKEDMVKRGLPSPDEADAVCLAFAPTPATDGDYVQDDQYDELDLRQELFPWR